MKTLLRLAPIESKTRRLHRFQTGQLFQLGRVAQIAKSALCHKGVAIWLTGLCPAVFLVKRVALNIFQNSVSNLQAHL